MKNRFIVLSLCSTMAAPLLSAASLYAEESTPAQGGKKAESKLEEMVVTATRVAESPRDIPASIQIISQETIKGSTAKDAGELMAEAGIGHVHKYNGALTGNVEIRGLSTDLFTESSSRVLILINGNRAGTTNLAKIPSSEIERIEIVKGPASVVYGSQAMGGVVNIITKSGKEGMHGSAGAEGGSFGYWKSMVDLNGKKGAVDYFISGGLSSSDDYSTPSGKYGNTSYATEEFAARAGYSFLNSHRLSAGYQHWKGKKVGSPNMQSTPDPDDYSDKSRDAFDLEYKNSYMTLKYYIANNKDDSYSTGGMGLPGQGNSDRFTANTRTQGVSLVGTIPIGEHRITVGGQWDRNAVDTSSSSGAPYYPNSLYDNFAIFAEGKAALLEKKLLLTAGVRYDYFDNSTLATPGLSGTPISKTMDAVTARGGVVYKAFDGLSLKAAVGTAFRAPSPRELASNYTLYGYQTVGNANLSPEKSITFDAGFDYAKNLFKGGFTFFHTDFTDRIASYYDSGLAATTYRNLGSATIQGVEINAAYDAGLAAGLDISIEPFASVTYKTRYDSGYSTGSDGKLMYVPEWTGAFGIKAGQEKWDGKLTVNYTGEEYVTDYTSAYPYPVIRKGGYMLVNLKGSYRPMKHLELHAAIGNLFDKSYDYVKGYTMPGRSFVAGAKWMF